MRFVILMYVLEMRFVTLLYVTEMHCVTLIYVIQMRYNMFRIWKNVHLRFVFIIIIITVPCQRIQVCYRFKQWELSYLPTTTVARRLEVK